jgi:glyoxylase-like metal-dependent hydrolase (beta-lactamase superfamily II)
VGLATRISPTPARAQQAFGASAVALVTHRHPVATQIVAAEQQRAAAAPSPGALSVFDSGEAGFFTRTYFYDTGGTVVAFDAQFTPALAETALADLRRRSASPVQYLVVTHPNPDKFNGAPAFQEVGAHVIASQATAEAIPEVHAYQRAFFVGNGMFTEESYPRQASVDETFTEGMTLHLGPAHTVELVKLGQPGVSSSQTVAYLPERHALIVGDLIHHKVHAWLEGGIVAGKATPAIAGWIADLRELEERFTSDPEPMVYGGRGEPAPLSEAVAAQVAYLTRADAIVSDYVAALGDEAGQLDGPEAAAHYLAIQDEVAQAFPDYTYPAMIGFSVYGLVNAKR